MIAYLYLSANSHACSWFYDVSEYILLKLKQVCTVIGAFLYLIVDMFSFYLFHCRTKTEFLFVKFQLCLSNISLMPPHIVSIWLCIGISLVPSLLILVDMGIDGGHDGAALLQNTWYDLSRWISYHDVLIDWAGNYR